MPHLNFRITKQLDPETSTCIFGIAYGDANPLLDNQYRAGKIISAARPLATFTMNSFKIALQETKNWLIEAEQHIPYKHERRGAWQLIMNQTQSDMTLTINIAGVTFTTIYRHHPVNPEWEILARPAFEMSWDDYMFVIERTEDLLKRAEMF